MKEIKNYAVRLNGDLTGSGDFLRAQIHLFDVENKLAGIFNFYDTAGGMAGSAQNSIIKTSMHIDRLADVVDLLRNEKPIYLGWRGEGEKAFISTSQEPVGEGE
ncbi:MAG: hypothetical protein MRZ79_18255 [Bacteroidia bacterium]|nr:hypothetical protein [Bacteroidia bacterium]